MLSHNALVPVLYEIESRGRTLPKYKKVNKFEITGICEDDRGVHKDPIYTLYPYPWLPHNV